MSKAFHDIDLSSARIPWRTLDRGEIDRIRRAAHEAGDKVVASRAARALARR